MSSIQAKTLRDKIELFIKIADEDGNGNLSYDEVFTLSKICLSKYINIEYDGDDFLDELCHYFARLIFSVVAKGLEEEIPLDLIKEAIIHGNQERALLTMFCGADG